MSPLVINYVALIVGLVLIGMFWMFLTKNKSDAEKKSVRRWVITFFVLGIVMFTIQYVTLGLN